MSSGSIFLNDITAVVQFDDTHFQVESRTRNFFLCGDSKACTSCWVKSLDEYRKRLSAFEKEKAKYDALAAAAQAQLSADAQAAFSPKAVAAIANAQISHENKRANNSKTPVADESRDSFSSSSSRGSSASSNSKRVGRTAERQPRGDERRTPSPAEARDSRDRDSSASRKPDRAGDKSDAGRSREPSRERGREQDRASVSRTNSRQFENRTIGNASSVRGHPGKGYVMQAWVDEDQ